MTRDSVHTIKITGDAGLRATQELAGILRGAIDNHSIVVISMNADSVIDVTTIQLLLAARKLASASGKSLSLAAPCSGAFRELLIATGCLDASGQSLTPEADFWTSTPSAKGKAA